MPNRLIHSTSPYLLQHAHNPVDWYEWGADAMAKAKLENRPILVSIGYSACHWCHVMEHESFENNDIAAIMNGNFVCIKVDREERPDVDQVYMEAVQLLGINGGWPLNVFLTPDQKPFYGGTYFPPSNWKNILQQVSQVFKDRRPEIEASADEIAEHLNKSDVQRFTQDSHVAFRKEQLNKMFSILESRFDKMHGGIAKAPKFVMPTIWMLLLRYFAVSDKTQARDMVGLTLRKMTSAGLYDQLGGGFARYSVDGEWFAPHFEKMLYDNGQLLTLYAEMYRLTRDDFYKDICTETIGWLAREMKHPDGGFYSALDADSEGEEGKFYVWTWDELQDIIKEKEAMEYFGAETSGNWEHGQNILRRGEADKEKVKTWQEPLLRKRSERIRPGTDDKILTGWNGIAIKGLTDAFVATGTKEYLDLAIGGMTFIENHLSDGLQLYRSFKEKRSHTGGFLEDYAFVIQSSLALYQATFQENWIRKAEALTAHVIQQYFEKESGYFHFTADSAEALIARKKEIFDNVIPSSNSVMARNLYHLGIMLDRREWTTMAEEMVAKLAPTIEGEPAYLSNWGILLTEMIKGMAEVVIVGPDALKSNHELQRNFLPFALFMGTTGTSQLPLLSDKTAVGGQTTIYVCFQKSCKMPVNNVEEALGLITSPRSSPQGEGEN